MLLSSVPAAAAAGSRRCSSLACCLCFMQTREITNNVAPEPFRWTAEGLLALQEATEVRVGYVCGCSQRKAAAAGWRPRQGLQCLLLWAVAPLLQINGPAGLSGPPAGGLQPLCHPCQARHHQ